MSITKAQEEYFKDTKIRNEDGSLMKVYHGSPNTFDTFDKSLIGRRLGESCGSGFNFTPNKEYAESLADGKNAMLVEAYINITKPLSSDKFILTKDDIVDIVDTLVTHFNNYYDCISQEAAEQVTEKLLEYYDENIDTVHASDVGLLTEIEYEFRDMISSVEDYSELLTAYVDEHADEIEEYYDVEEDEYYFNEEDGLLDEVKEKINDYVFETLGFDGYIGASFNGFDVYVCIEPNQIKSVDNLYPTKSDNFVDNSKEYFKDRPMTLEDKINMAKVKQSEKSHTDKTKSRDREL